MREIQFEYIFENIRYGGIHKEVYSLIDIENGYPIEFVDDNKEYRLKWRRQYTGLKDKNGVEIYEGDIVKNSFDDENYKIIFKNGSFVLHSDEQFIYPDSLHHHLQENVLEVIGNIYENQELLIGAE